MSKTKPIGWIVKRDLDGAYLGRNGKWYRMFSHYGDFRQFKRPGNALKFGLKYEQGTAYALYSGDTIDVVGNITRTPRQGYELKAQINSK